jgi:nucleotide-binding universal stress UspA family protein
VPYAISLAQKHNSHLTLLHVLEDSQGATVDFEPNEDFAIRRMQELILRDSDVWFRSNCAVEFGCSEDEIVRLASNHGADLIVLGIRAPQGPLTTLTHLAHSRAQHIVAHATCPVLTVRG